MEIFPYNPKTKSPNPIRARYMRRLAGASSFILVVKTLKRHQFDYRYSIEVLNRFSDWTS
ncbi:hypothetical protein E5E51_06100 [Helicobacter pylori]|nr:hypothetical protein E5E51_06100 [Helicobacter pylori]